MCGAVYNAISRSRKDSSDEIEIHTWDMVKSYNIKEDAENKREIPDDIRDFLTSAKIL